MNQSSENSDPLNYETVQSVIEHMNNDHSDASLSIARAFSEQGNAVAHAQLIGMDKRGMIFMIQTSGQHESAGNQNIRVNFPKPLRTETQIRGALVGLTRQARQQLTK